MSTFSLDCGNAAKVRNLEAEVRTAVQMPMALYKNATFSQYSDAYAMYQKSITPCHTGAPFAQKLHLTFCHVALLQVPCGDGNTMHNLRRWLQLLYHCCVTTARWRRAVNMSGTMSRLAMLSMMYPVIDIGEQKVPIEFLNPVSKTSRESVVAAIPSSGTTEGLENST